jgi:hypothetical protein
MIIKVRNRIRIIRINIQVTIRIPKFKKVPTLVIMSPTELKMQKHKTWLAVQFRKF